MGDASAGQVGCVRWHEQVSGCLESVAIQRRLREDQLMQGLAQVNLIVTDVERAKEFWAMLVNSGADCLAAHVRRLPARSHSNGRPTNASTPESASGPE